MWLLVQCRCTSKKKKKTIFMEYEAYDLIMLDPGVILIIVCTLYGVRTSEYMS